jgi:limonene-1,2-epoxide hydrolase
MKNTNTVMPATKNAAELVLSFVQALNEEDYTAARQCIDDKMSFVGVLGTRSDAESYIGDMERIKLKYDIKKVFVDGNDVCLWYDIQMGGVSVLTCGWYHVVNGKILSLKVVFDPRPVLEQPPKK